MSTRRDILTKRQIRVLNAVRWFGDVEQSHGLRIFRREISNPEFAQEKADRREIRRLTKRGYLSRGRLSRKGRGVTVADEWNTGIPILREMIMESKR